jgi:hypothetical protein
MPQTVCPKNNETIHSDVAQFYGVAVQEIEQIRRTQI